MSKILLWIKGNYEKLILGIFLILLIIMGLRLSLGVDKNKELEDFANKIKPPKTSTMKLESLDSKDWESYLTKKSFSYYQLLIDRAVFLPVVTKSQGPSQPQMNLECAGVISDTEGVLSTTLRNPQTGKTYKVKVGEQAENLAVVSITRDVVIISDGTKQYRLNPPTVTMPFKLTGIMPTETGSQAMLQSDTTKKTSFVNAGDEVEGWKVLSIDENKVIISRPDSGKYELAIGGEFQRIKE